MRKTLTLAALCALLAFGTAIAQEEMKPKKFDSLDWYTLVDVKYKSGKLDEALKTIREHFAKAGEAAGVPGPKMLVNHTGPWDVTFMWKMEGGISDMEWEMSANNIKWMGALAAQEGGMDKAQEVMGSYYELVDRFDRRVVRMVSFGAGGEKKE